MPVENAGVLCGKKLCLTPEATCDRGSAPASGGPGRTYPPAHLLSSSLSVSFSRAQSGTVLVLFLVHRVWDDARPW